MRICHTTLLRIYRSLLRMCWAPKSATFKLQRGQTIGMAKFCGYVELDLLRICRALLRIYRAFLRMHWAPESATYKLQRGRTLGVCSRCSIAIFCGYVGLFCGWRRIVCKCVLLQRTTRQLSITHSTI